MKGSFEDVLNRVELFVLSLCFSALVSCGSAELPISGRVLIDGAPMESGTLHLEPVEAGSGKSAGGLVENGELQLASGHGLVPGKYRVSATAFKKTGNTINDYQRGVVEEMLQLTLKDSPQEIELGPDNSANLTIEFKTAVRRKP